MTDKLIPWWKINFSIKSTASVAREVSKGDLL